MVPVMPQVSLYAWIHVRETPRKRIMFMSSFNEISTDQLGNGMVVTRGEELK
jgi:hypothetical protein